MPRGWNRTWPHLVSMEAMRCAESYAFDENHPEKVVWHNTILSFTRNVIGSMDYTPVAFLNQKFPHKTSFGDELALSIVFESGILQLADNSETYRSWPETPKNFLKTVPVVRNETLLLARCPGKDCVMARKSGKIWYIGGINGTGEKQSWEIDLARLKGNGFSASLISDGATDKEFSSYETEIKLGDRLKVDVLPFGGFVAILK